MKIFFFGSDYAPTGGGIATYTETWLAALSQRKDTEISTRIFGNKNPRSFKLGSMVKVTTVHSVNFFYVGIRIFFDVLLNLEYDVFHALNLFPVGFWTVFWTFIFRKKSVLNFYGADACDTRSSRKTVFLQKWALTHATNTLTVSHFTKQAVMKRYGISGDTINVIYPILPEKAIPTNKIVTENEKEVVRAKYGIKKDDFVILSVCRLVRRKGVELLIRAVAEKTLAGENVKVLIVGGGPERERLEEIMKSLNLSDKVFFAGKVPELGVYYSIASVSVLLSYIIPEEGDFEGLGIVLLEAQSYGLPVIGSKSGGIPEAFEEGKTGILVPEKDHVAVAQALLKLKKDTALYANMSSNTQKFLDERFGEENTIGKYIELIGAKK